MTPHSSQPSAAGGAAQSYSVAEFTGQSGFFLVLNRPMGGKFILAKFDPETTKEGRETVLRACNSHAALVAALEGCVLELEKAADAQRVHPAFGTFEQARAALASAKS